MPSEVAILALLRTCAFLLGRFMSSRRTAAMWPKRFVKGSDEIVFLDQICTPRRGCSGPTVILLGRAASRVAAPPRPLPTLQDDGPPCWRHRWRCRAPRASPLRASKVECVQVPPTIAILRATLSFRRQQITSVDLTSSEFMSVHPPSRSTGDHGNACHLFFVFIWTSSERMGDASSPFRQQLQTLPSHGGERA